MDAIATALFLALVNERAIEYFIAPLFDKFIPAGRWAIVYIALVTGGLLSFWAEVDLLAVGGVTLPYPVNLVVSAILVGGGATLLHRVFPEAGAPADA